MYVHTYIYDYLFCLCFYKCCNKLICSFLPNKKNYQSVVFRNRVSLGFALKIGLLSLFQIFLLVFQYFSFNIKYDLFSNVLRLITYSFQLTDN